MARFTVERLMRAGGIRGINRAKNPRDDPGTCVQRPKTSWGGRSPRRHRAVCVVADVTYIHTFSGCV